MALGARSHSIRLPIPSDYPPPGTLQLVQILHELGISDRPILHTDYQSMLASIKGNIYRGTHVTHIATKFHLAAEMVRNGEIEIRYAATVDIVADAMTKALPKPVFLPLCRRMGLRK